MSFLMRFAFLFARTKVFACSGDDDNETGDSAVVSTETTETDDSDSTPTTPIDTGSGDTGAADTGSTDTGATGA